MEPSSGWSLHPSVRTPTCGAVTGSDEETEVYGASLCQEVAELAGAGITKSKASQHRFRYSEVRAKPDVCSYERGLSSAPLYRQEHRGSESWPQIGLLFSCYSPPPSPWGRTDLPAPLLWPWPRDLLWPMTVAEEIACLLRGALGDATACCCSLPCMFVTCRDEVHPV